MMTTEALQGSNECDIIRFSRVPLADEHTMVEFLSYGE